MSKLRRDARPAKSHVVLASALNDDVATRARDVTAGLAELEKRRRRELMLLAPPVETGWLRGTHRSQSEVDVASWNDLSSAAPELAEAGHALITRSGIGEGLLATLRHESLPRIHPVYVGVVDGRLVSFVASMSAKAADLAEDGRYAFHTHIDPGAPHEFQVRGRANRVTDATLVQHALAAWAFDAAEGYDLFELDVSHALLGRRPTADDWPPVYTSWRTSADS
jgi:hypothetical protein